MCGRGVGILFEVRHAETRPGELVSVVGDLPELGAWDAYTSPLQLHTGSYCYPLWATLNPRQVEIGTTSSSNTCSLREREDSNECCEEVDTPEEARETPENLLEEADVWASPRQTLQAQGFGSIGRAVLHIQYKYVKDRRQLRDNGPSIIWESSIANRSVAIPLEPGSMWIVSDAKFNDSREPATLTRTSLIQILARQSSLGMACASRTHQRAEAESPEWTGLEHEEDSMSHASSLTNESHHTTSTIGIFGQRVNQATAAGGMDYRVLDA